MDAIPEIVFKIYCKSVLNLKCDSYKYTSPAALVPVPALIPVWYLQLSYFMVHPATSRGHGACKNTCFTMIWEQPYVFTQKWMWRICSNDLPSCIVIFVVDDFDQIMSHHFCRMQPKSQSSLLYSKYSVYTDERIWVHPFWTKLIAMRAM